MSVDWCRPLVKKGKSRKIFLGIGLISKLVRGDFYHSPEKLSQCDLEILISEKSINETSYFDAAMEMVGILHRCACMR
jgi:hypothetical protein